MRGIARRVWLIPLAMIAVAAIAFGVNRALSHEVTAQSVVLVTSQAGPDGPGFATEAAQLALSYSNVIDQDQAVVQRIAGVIGRSNNYVRDHFNVVNPTNTATLNLRFRDKSPSEAAAASRAAAQAIAGAHPVTPAVGPSSIQIVRLADRPKKASNGDVLAIAIGLVLGFGFGVVLLLAWERADPRIDDANDALAQTGLPATTLETLTPQAVTGLIERWARLSEHAPARVAIIPISPSLIGVANQIAARLESYAVPRQRRFNGGRLATQAYENGVPEIVATGLLGTDGSAEAEALRSDVRVLLVTKGFRERKLDSAASLLHQFGTPADWLLIGRSRKRVEQWLLHHPLPEDQLHEEEAGTPQA